MVTNHSEFIQITGKAAKSFHAKNGIGLVVEVFREGAQYPTRYTAWEFPQPVPEQGDTVTVKGWFSSRTTKKEEKTYIDFSINKPVLVSSEPREQVAPVASEWDTVAPPADGPPDVWHEPGQAVL